MAQGIFLAFSNNEGCTSGHLDNRLRLRNGDKRQGGKRRQLGAEHLEKRQLLAAEFGGWVGSYFGSGTPDALPDLVRHDAIIDFDWGDRSALNNTGNSNGSAARWESNLLTDHTATHQLILRSEPQDGLRLWVDNQIVVDAWNGVGSEEVVANVPLIADQATSVRVEYRDIAGASRLWLGWTSPELPIEVLGPEWTPLSQSQQDSINDGDPNGILFEQLSSVDSGFLNTGRVKYSDVASGVRLSAIDVSASGTSYPAQRTRGFIVPADTGHYQFRISGGDANRLLLADDDTAELARVIAASDSATAPGQWGADVNQLSSSIPLVAGLHYYFEARQTSNGDFGGLEVQWRKDRSAWEAIPSGQLHPLMAETSVRAVVSAIDETDDSPVLSFDVSRTDDFGRDVTVQLDYGGTATRGVDYVGAFPSVTIPAGQRSARVDVTAVKDRVDDPFESIHVGIAPSSQYELATPIRTRTTLTIAGQLLPEDTSLLGLDPLNLAAIDNTNGSRFGSFSNRTAEGEDNGTINGTVLVLNTIAQPPNESSISATWDLNQNVAAGETVIADFYYRRLGTKFAGIVFEIQDRLSFNTWGTTALTATGFWQRAQIPITSGELLSRNSSEVEFLFGPRENGARIEIANFQFVIEGETVDPNPLLPQSFDNYDEREANNDWRWQARQNVLENRRNELLINVTDESGSPVAGATIEVGQLDHSYGFGNIIRSQYVSDIYADSRTAEAARHRAIAARLFNTITIANGVRWRLWDINDQIGRQSLDWVNENVQYMHGHHLTWGQLRMIPNSVQAEYERLSNEVSQAAATEYLRTTQLAHVADIASELGGTIDGTDLPRVAHWDTVNHPVLLKEIWDILRGNGPLSGPIGEVFDQAKANAHPDTLQMINEGQTIERVGIPRRTEYYNLIEELLNNGKPVEAIGFMNHFDFAQTPSPTQFNAYLDEFAELGLPLAMTEFDINATGIDLQTQADWSEDYYLNVFANPATEFVIGWGFWEGAHWRSDEGAHWYNADWEAKPNADVFVDQIHREWQTNTRGSTRADGTYRTMAFDGTHEVTVTINGQTYLALAEVDESGGLVNVVVDSPTTLTDGTRIEAEDFNLGGQGVGYFDTTNGNTGGQYRVDESVDIGATADGGGGHFVGWVRDNEWLNYSVDIVGGTYDVDFRVATPNSNRKIELLISEDESGTEFTTLASVTVPNTGGHGNWDTVQLSGIDLSPWAGTRQVIRVQADGSGFNLNWLEFNQQLTAVDDVYTVGEDLQLFIPKSGLLGNDIAGSMGPVGVTPVTGLATTGGGLVTLFADGSFQYTPALNFLGVDTFEYQITGSGNGNGDTATVSITVLERLEVESIQISNDPIDRKPALGHSIIDVIRVMLDGTATFNAGAFAVETAAGQSVPVVVDMTAIDGKAIATITFAPEASTNVNRFGSLIDGSYKLKIDGSEIIRDGIAMDANHDGEPGGTYEHTDGFFAKYGDVDGSGTVGLIDFAAFRSTFGSDAGDPHFDDSLDFDRDQSIGLTDFAKFRSVFGR